MSASSYDNNDFCPIPLGAPIDTAALTAANSSLDFNPTESTNSLSMNLGDCNDNDLLSSEAMDIFEAVTDSSSYGRPSPTLLDQQDADCLDFEDFPGLSQDMHIQGSAFNYKDDTFGALSTDDENEEYCAELAEKWVEEQIQQEDFRRLSLSNGHCSDNYWHTAPPGPPAGEHICKSESSASLKSPGPIPTALNPITPVQPSIQPTKSAHKRAKRSVSEVSNSSSTQKPGKRRNAKNQAHTLTFRSQSRIRMDKALQERSQAQMALREAVRNLKKAQATERECRARYASAKLLVDTTAEKECDALLREETQWNKMFHQLKTYKDETGGCNIKQVEDSKSPEMARLTAWICKNRKDCKLNGKSSHSSRVSSTHSDEPKVPMEQGSSPRSVATSQSKHAAFAHSTENQAVFVSSEEVDDASVFEDLDVDSILADPYKKIALNRIGFEWDPRRSRWNEMYKQLQEFKAAHGTTLVPQANFGLGAWVKRQQLQYNFYISGSKTELTEERVRMLNDLGFVWNRRSKNWNENFQRLKRWSEEHGSCHIPDGTEDPELVALSKWIADQRAHYKRQIADDSPNESDTNDETTTKKKSKKKVSKLSPEKIEALTSIGFEFDARDAKWLQKFDLLVEYKKIHGDFLVPSGYKEDPTLSNWVSSQRQQYNYYQKGCKSHMTERRLKILTDAGFPFASKKEEIQKKKDEATQQDINEFDAKPWLEKYKDLLLHIAQHGSIDSLQKSNSLLHDWIVNQREEFLCPVSESIDPDTINPTEKEYRSLIKTADLFASTLAAECAEAYSSSLNKELLSWDCQFGSLAAWYIKYGTYSNKGMPTKLKKFMSKQQEHHRLLCSGAESELTPDRVEKLSDIFFPFDSQVSNECASNDTTAARRNRSWEEYRLDLAISYIRKGNYDMQAIDDQELRRWATEQKRQHKLYLAGKQSSLSFTQIQRLIDIRFISKRAKQWSFPELCGDLMAFRIQFGTFDVANAKVVTNYKASKGKPLCSSIAFTTLHNIQELTNKLKTAMHEFTEDQLTKLNSVSFPWVEPAVSSSTPSESSSSQVAVSIAGNTTTHTKTASNTQFSASLDPPLVKNIFGMTLEMSPMTKQ